MCKEECKSEEMKYRLAEAVKVCMKTTSVEKITVKEIVDACGTTRQTFYRHFQDKYDLVNWYFDKIILESFEHMGEGETIYEGLVKKFQYIQKEKLFFKMAFKSDDQNCLRDHDFELIPGILFRPDPGKIRKAIVGRFKIPAGNVLPGFYLHDCTMGVWKGETHAGGTGSRSRESNAGRTGGGV